jgi:hypothetical protein
MADALTPDWLLTTCVWSTFWFAFADGWNVLTLGILALLVFWLLNTPGELLLVIWSCDVVCCGGLIIWLTEDEFDNDDIKPSSWLCNVLPALGNLLNSGSL